jgi:hypothetical protein
MAKQPDKRERTVSELEDELKIRNQRIEELREEVDELRDLVTRLREQDEDTDNVFESWKETFEMTRNENGKLTWQPFWDEHWKLIDDYNDLVRRWNKYLPLINHEPRNVGRPLAASEAQVIEVHKLRKTGRSLRGIADDTSLGLDTVRTIVSKMNRKDRTTKKHRERLERIDVDRFQRARWKRQRRTGDALPRRVQAAQEQGRALAKEARGLGKP